MGYIIHVTTGSLLPQTSTVQTLALFHAEVRGVLQGLSRQSNDDSLSKMERVKLSEWWPGTAYLLVDNSDERISSQTAYIIYQLCMNVMQENLSWVTVPSAKKNRSLKTGGRP